MRPKEHSAVLDASAVLVLLGDERGAAVVSRYVGSAVMGAVNYAEVVTKLVERGATPVEVQALLAGPAPTVVAFDRELAAQSGFLARLLAISGYRSGIAPASHWHGICSCPPSRPAGHGRTSTLASRSS